MDGQADVVAPGPFCICEGLEREGDFMVGCDRTGCDIWHHGHCVGIVAEFVSETSTYICPSCSKSTLGVFNWADAESRKPTSNASGNVDPPLLQDESSERDLCDLAPTEPGLEKDKARSKEKGRRKTVTFKDVSDEENMEFEGDSMLVHRRLLTLRPSIAKAVAKKHNAREAFSAREYPDTLDQDSDDNNGGDFESDITIDNDRKRRFLAHRVMREEEEYDGNVSCIEEESTQELILRAPVQFGGSIFDAEQVKQLAAYRLVKTALETALVK